MIVALEFPFGLKIQQLASFLFYVHLNLLLESSIKKLFFELLSDFNSGDQMLLPVCKLRYHRKRLSDGSLYKFLLLTTKGAGLPTTKMGQTNEDKNAYND